MRAGHAAAFPALYRAGNAQVVKRIALLDGLRGFLIVFMLMNHLTFSGSFALGWLNYAHFTFMQSAQGFIFLSGLLVGLAYMSMFDRRGPGTALRRLSRRSLELYGWHLALVLIVLVLSRLIMGSSAAWGDWLGHLYADGMAYVLTAAGLLYQPTFMDILPQYILYLLVSPLVLWLVAGRRVWLIATLSLSAWLFVQLGACLPLVTGLEAMLRYGSTDLVVRAHFNPLAWQILFIPGVTIGALMARGEFVPERAFLPEHTAWLSLALSILLFFLGWRLALLAGWVDTPVLLRFQAFERRNEFGPVYLLSFLAAAYAIAWLLIAGPRSGSVVATTAARWLRALLHHPFIMLLGRHALPVYAFHVLLVYGLKLADWKLGPLGDPWSSLLALISIAALAIPALLAERRRTLAANDRPTTGTRLTTPSEVSAS